VAVAGLGGSTAPQLAAADRTCRRLARRHYENFSVVMAFLPRDIRTDLARVYAYCRFTDDLGDESGGPAQHLLSEWRRSVAASLVDGERPDHPVLLAVADTVLRRRLPLQPFLDLIDANLQDQSVAVYQTWDDLITYCRLSAAPVGRMVLGVVGLTEPCAVRLADDVCIGLQLANFAQDVTVDERKGRRYLPAEALTAGGRRGAVRLMCERAETLLFSGVDLERLAPGRVRLQLSLYRLGGEAIVSAIRRSGYRTDEHRPCVPRRTKARLFLRALAGLRQRDDGTR